MNIINIFDSFSKAAGCEEEMEIMQSRRQAFKNFSNFGKKMAISAVPIGVLAGLPKIAYGQEDNTAIVEALNFALTLEYLESDYYNMGLDTNALIPGEDQPIFQQISKHEDAHVVFLTDTISSLGGTPVEKPTFDFTAGGTFDPFGDYNQFLTLSQGFEDLGVRAYKGQAGNVMSNDTVLQAGLQIHAVEARHAAEVRRLRRIKGLAPDQEAWIHGAGADAMLPEEAAGIYEGEANVTHLEVDVTTVSEISPEAIQEAWDEPLTLDQVNAIAALFLPA